MKDVDMMHKYWHAFCDFLDQNEIDKHNLDYGKDMDLIDSYSETHPEIKLVRVDDSHFCGSDLILIPHPDMGITVLFNPQCSRDNNEFFMYPGHIDHLISVLQEMKETYGLDDGFEAKNGSK